MLQRLTFVALFLALGPGDGRRGNAHYEAEQYQEAAAAYARGLEALGEGGDAALRYGLLNNLGAALHQSGDFEAAQAALDGALAAAQTEADYARAAYNAGNNAFEQEELERALDRYREALLADPDNEDAKFNYEYVKRQLDEQQQQQQQQGGQRSDQQQEQQDEQGRGQDDETSDDFEPDPSQQQQDSQQGEEGNEDQPQPQEPQQQDAQDADQLSRAQAERILQALEQDEEELLRQVQKLKARPRRVEKDW